MFLFQHKHLWWWRGRQEPLRGCTSSRPAMGPRSPLWALLAVLIALAEGDLQVPHGACQPLWRRQTWGCDPPSFFSAISRYWWNRQSILSVSLGQILPRGRDVGRRNRGINARRIKRAEVIFKKCLHDSADFLSELCFALVLPVEPQICTPN